MALADHVYSDQERDWWTEDIRGDRREGIIRIGARNVEETREYW